MKIKRCRITGLKVLLNNLALWVRVYISGNSLSLIDYIDWLGSSWGRVLFFVFPLFCCASFTHFILPWYSCAYFALLIHSLTYIKKKWCKVINLGYKLNSLKGISSEEFSLGFDPVFRNSPRLFYEDFTFLWVWDKNKSHLFRNKIVPIYYVCDNKREKDDVVGTMSFSFLFLLVFLLHNQTANEH